MAENSSSIKAAVPGAGFFSASGELKNKSELKEKVEVDKGSSAPASSSSVSKAISRVEERFSAAVDNVAREINGRAAQLKETRQALKKEKEALKDLKQAFEDGDQEKAAKIQDNLRDIRQQRAERSAQIEEQQRLTSEDRSIRIGNKEQARVTVPKIKPPKVEEEIPDNIRQVKKQLDQVNDDLEAVKTQQQDIAEARKNLGEVLSTGRKELDQISQNSIKNIEAAEQSANKIASEARNLTRDELLSSVAGKLDPASVSQALRS